MYRDEIIVNLAFSLQKLMPEADPQIIHQLIEAELNECDMQPMTHAIALNADIYDRIKMFLQCKRLAKLSVTTLYNYDLQLKRFASMIRKNVEDITTADIRMCLYYFMNDCELKDNTVRNISDILRSFFKWLTVERYISYNPMDKIEYIKCGIRTRDPLTLEELELMRMECDTLREAAMLEFGFSTGLRVAEIASVNVSDLNFDKRCLKVIGKGNKERVVLFSVKAKILLKRYLQARDGNIFGPLFINAKSPYNRLSTRSIEKEIKAIAEKAGLERKVSPHILRHTFATMAYQSGMPIVSIQKLLGHTQLTTTQIYVETNMETIFAEHNRCMMM